MICPQCKTWVTGTVNFCSRCGTPKAMFLPDGAVAPLPRAPVPPAPPSMTVAPAVQMALGLRPGERAIRMWRAGYVVPGRYYDEDDAIPVMLSGILVASDQRLIFVQEKGLLNKSYQPMDSLELRQITGHQDHLFAQDEGAGGRPRGPEGTQKAAAIQPVRDRSTDPKAGPAVHSG